MQVDVSLNVCFLCAFGLTALKHNSVSFRVMLWIIDWPWSYPPLPFRKAYILFSKHVSNPFKAQHIADILHKSRYLLKTELNPLYDYNSSWRYVPMLFRMYHHKQSNVKLNGIRQWIREKGLICTKQKLGKVNAMLKKWNCTYLWLEGTKYREYSVSFCCPFLLYVLFMKGCT